MFGGEGGRECLVCMIIFMYNMPLIICISLGGGVGGSLSVRGREEYPPLTHPSPLPA